MLGGVPGKGGSVGDVGGVPGWTLLISAIRARLDV